MYDNEFLENDGVNADFGTAVMQLLPKKMVLWGWGWLMCPHVLIIQTIAKGS